MPTNCAFEKRHIQEAHGRERQLDPGQLCSPAEVSVVSEVVAATCPGSWVVKAALDGSPAAGSALLFSSFHFPKPEIPEGREIIMGD